MDILTQLLGDKQVYLALVSAGTLLLGKLAKEHPKIWNGLIPVITFVASCLGFSLTPVGAEGGGAVVTAGAVATVITTVAHTLGKNTVLPVVKKAWALVKGWF